MYIYYVYMLTNIKRNVMYVGVTNDLGRRVVEHRQGIGGGFTRRYHVNVLVYAEEHELIDDAIAREADKGLEPRQEECVGRSIEPDLGQPRR